jgi:thiol peroxidase
MAERTGVVTVGGNPVTLVGNEVNVGDKAPDFEVVDNDLNPVSSSEFDGKVRIIAVVASLDTSVCDVETRRFNQEAGKLGDDVVILTVSMDLPFAQKRWCGAAGVDQVKVLSDHKLASLGEAFGVLIKETRLLARSTFVVDRDGVIRYAQIVPELGTEPDYEPILKAAKELV